MFVKYTFTVWTSISSPHHSPYCQIFKSLMKDYRGLPVGVRCSGWLDKSKIRGKSVIHAAKSDEENYAVE